jgi:gamma-glutamyltranspeptidase
MNIQAAIDSPRWVHGKGFPTDPYEVLNMETRFPAYTFEGLERLGQRPRPTISFDRMMGYAQGIVINQANGLLMGGSDPRADSASIGW